MRQKIKEAIKKYRESINPPYRLGDAPAILGTLLILLAIPLTLHLASRPQNIKESYGQFTERAILNPIADSYVNDLSPNENYGTSTSLIIDNAPDRLFAYFKFDLSTLAGKQLTNVKFKFKTTSATDSGSNEIFEIRLVNKTDWEETTLTWRKKPALSHIVLGTFSNVAPDSWYETTLNTSYIQSKTGSYLSFAIRTDEGDDLIISSKETLNTPQLIIDYNISASGTPTPTNSLPSPTPTLPPPPSLTPAPTPTPTPSPGGIWKPPLKVSWQWMIDHALDINNQKDMGLVDPTGAVLNYPAPEVYDIDGFFNGYDPNCNIKDKNGVCCTAPSEGSTCLASSTQVDVVKKLHEMGKKVICYIDVGVYENYRPDAYKFPSSVIGKADQGWAGSYWLDIRRIDILGPIMEARIKMCKDKGYDALEPDEIDGVTNNSGFPLTKEDQKNYNFYIASLAHKYGLSVGFKGNLDSVGVSPWDPANKDLISQYVNTFDWILNEECFQYKECDDNLKPWGEAGKSILQVEYKTATSTFCPIANANNWNSMKMPLNLDGGRWPCR